MNNIKQEKKKSISPLCCESTPPPFFLWNIHQFNVVNNGIIHFILFKKKDLMIQKGLENRDLVYRILVTQSALSTKSSAV